MMSAMAFAEVEQRYRALKAQHDAGALSDPDFKARLQELMSEDAEGRWWVIGHETGQWYVHDGEQWAPGEPPRPAPEAPPSVLIGPEKPRLQPTTPAAPLPQPTPRRKVRKPWLWVAAGIIIVVLGANLIRQIGHVTSSPTPIPVPAGASVPPAWPSQTPAQVVELTTEPTRVVQPTAEPTRAAEPRQMHAGVVTNIVAPDCDYGGKLKAIEALDELTVRFTLCYADAAFPAQVALPPFGIHPTEYLAASSDTSKLLEAPIGTGPFRLTEWRRDEFVRMEANLDYWGEPAKFARLEFHWNDDADARLVFLATGDVDGIDSPPPEAYAEIQSNTNLTFVPRAGLNTGYLGISNLTKPFDDMRVRQAVALAIDRAWLVENLYPPGTVVASHFTPCEIPHGCTGEPWHDFDPDKARMLLAEAGYPDGFETELFYQDSPRSYLPDPQGTGQYIADMLQKFLNVQVKLTAIDSDAFRDHAWGGELPLYLFGYEVIYPDPINFLNPYWSEFSTERFANGFPDIRQVLREANWTASPEMRSELYSRANDLIKRTVPLIPLVHGGAAAAFRADVTGAHSSPLHLEQFATMGLKEGSTFIWKQTTMPQSLYCADEIDPNTWRACAQINEALLGFKAGSVEVVPALAQRYEPNEDLTEWTFRLRQDVKFHDGSALDATDVVTSWAVIWDAANPLHKGRTGAFDYFLWLFDAFLNAP